MVLMVVIKLKCLYCVNIIGMINSGHPQQNVLVAPLIFSFSFFSFFLFHLESTAALIVSGGVLNRIFVLLDMCVCVWVGVCVCVCV